MQNDEFERTRAEYLARLRRQLRGVPAAVRDDAVREVQAHVDDGTRAGGGDIAALRAVLARLGPPENYGRELAVQLLLQAGRRRRSPLLLLWAALFWAGTSVLGAVLMVGAALLYSFALGLIAVGVLRMLGSRIMLVDSRNFTALGWHADRLRFPPEAWSPALLALGGVLVVAALSAALYRLLSLWSRGRLAERGLAVALNRPSITLESGWERHVATAIGLFALLGSGSCLLFSLLSDLLAVGAAREVALPQDFFRTPLTFLAFAGALIFMCSPALGLWWAARRAQR